MLKRNFLIDYSQTMDNWNEAASPYEPTGDSRTGPPQASPVRNGQDPLRRDYGSLYLARDGAWGFPTPAERGSRVQAPNALIEKYYFKTQQNTGRSPLPGGEPPSYTPEAEAPTAVSPTERHGAGREPFILFGGYGELSTYGAIHQKIRIEANRSLLPNGGEIIPGLESDVGSSPDRATIPDIDAWRRWCIQNYYGREAAESGRGSFKTYVEHAATYESPFTPQERSLSPNDRTAASVNFEYNYYIGKYETGIQNEPVDSQTLYPHLYTMYFEKSRQLGLEDASDVVLGDPTIIAPSYNEDFIYSDFITLNRS